MDFYHLNSRTNGGMAQSLLGLGCNSNQLDGWDWEAIGNTATDIFKIGQEAGKAVQSFRTPTTPSPYSSPYPSPYAQQQPQVVYTQQPANNTNQILLISGIGFAAVLVLLLVKRK